MKVDAQVASDTLIPAVRRSIGGADSVRGYREQEYAGDDAVTATLELRTPLFQNFIPGLEKSDEYLAATPDAWQRHRLQFLAFTDFGYAVLKDPLPGEQDSETMGSAGVGLRLGLTKWSQLRFDVGFPFNETPDTKHPARGHFSLQLQF